MPEKVHHGRAVKRIRELLHIKQDTIAMELNVTQQAVSLLENKETIDPEMLEQIARTMGVAVDAIKNYNEEAAVNITQNNYEGSNAGATNVSANNNATFNTMEKWLEAIEENKKLYERLLQTEREKVALLEKVLSEKKK